MLKIPARTLVLALLSGGLQILIFPKPGLYPLCWIALAPLLYALLRGQSSERALLDSEGSALHPLTLKQGFFVAWLSGLVAYYGTCYWVCPTMIRYGNLAVPVAGLITIAAGFAMALHHGVFGLLVVLMARRSASGNRRPLLLAPFFWIAIELFRDRVSGFPWNLLGNTQVDNIPFARIAEVTGVYGLSFAIVLVNCVFAAAFLIYGKQRRTNLLISAVASAVALQVGVLVKPAPYTHDKEAVLVQHNAPVLDGPWTPRAFDELTGELSKLTVAASPKNPAGKPGLIVWPESPAPFFTSDPRLQRWLRAIAEDRNAYMVVGSVGVLENQESKDPRAPQLLLNSALIVGPGGELVGRYDKIHLAPFGEYIPFKNLLSFASKLTREVGDFTPGTERKVFNLSGTRVAVIICYESVFGNEVREFAGNGAQVLVNISDDMWFGESSGPFQHLQMTRMRAVENHRWILLTTNSGTTAVIDPSGRIVKKAERNVRTAMLAPFSAESHITFYSRFGDLFAWMCVLISCLAVLVRFQIPARTTVEVRPA